MKTYEETKTGLTSKRKTSNWAIREALWFRTINSSKMKIVSIAILCFLIVSCISKDDKKSDLAKKILSHQSVRKSRIELEN